MAEDIVSSMCKVVPLPPLPSENVPVEQPQDMTGNPPSTNGGSLQGVTPNNHAVWHFGTSFIVTVS